MFNRYLIVKNKGIGSLYLYIDDYYEFSSDFNSGSTTNKNLKDVIKAYIRDNRIIFNGTKVFIVLSGLVISYVILDDNLPIDKNWVADFEPILKINDRTETINDLIDKEIEIDI